MLLYPPEIARLGHHPREILVELGLGLVEIIPVDARAELGCRVPGEGADASSQVERLSLLAIGMVYILLCWQRDVVQNSTEPVHRPVDDILGSIHTGLGEEGVEGGAPVLVHVVIGRVDRRRLHREPACAPAVLVPSAILSVELLVKGRVVHVQLVGADADDGAFTNKLEYV